MKIIRMLLGMERNAREVLGLLLLEKERVVQVRLVLRGLI